MERYQGRFAIWGPPGTGKTTFLAKQVREIAAELCDPDASPFDRGAPVAICSLTRTAAAEIAGRDLPIPRRQIGTLHALAYRQLGHPDVAEGELQDWCEFAPEYRMTVSNNKGAENTINDQMACDWSPDLVGDKLYQELCRVRAVQKPRNVWNPSVLLFEKRWNEWKFRRGLVDFTDIIELALKDVDCAPGNPQVVIADEAQDMSKLELELLMKWGESAGGLMLAGDPWQCQPTGTMVETSGGVVPIEQLDPKHHRLVSFNRRSSEITGRRNPLAFKIASRLYRGRLIRVEVDGVGATRCTPEHLWTVKIDRADSAKLYAVYLMQLGDRWRVGRAKLFRSPNNDAGSFGPVQRCRQEQGDRVWILSTFDNVRRAECWQQIVSCRYRIPTTCFKDHGLGNRTSSEIDEIYDHIGPIARPNECLQDFGRKREFPFWESPYVRSEYCQNIGRRIPLTVRACNLLPSAMRVPVPTGGKTFDWRRFDVSNELYDGKVWSLEVERHEHYIADGIVTHNCLYMWRGADPSVFTDSRISEGHRRILSQSYRVPEAVYRASMRWMRQWYSAWNPLDYKPRRQEGGEVVAGEVRKHPGMWRDPSSVIDTALRLEERGESVMLAATCGFMLRNIVAELKRAGVPFANPWRRRRGDWNPLHVARGTPIGQRILDFLRIDKKTYTADWKAAQARLWTWGELANWISVQKASSFLKRGRKKIIASMAEEAPDQECTPFELKDAFKEDVFDGLMSMGDQGETSQLMRFFAENLLGSRKKTAEYPVKVARLRGARSLAQEPRIYVGTVHSFKGAEADNVFLFPDLSPAAMLEWKRSGEPRDGVARTIYVGITRAKQRLFVCQKSSMSAVDLGGLTS